MGEDKNVWDLWSDCKRKEREMYQIGGQEESGVLMSKLEG